MESHSKALWRSWLARRPVTAEVAGSSPVRVAIYLARHLGELGAFRPGSSVGMSVRLKSGRSPVRSRPWPPRRSHERHGVTAAKTQQQFGAEDRSSNFRQRLLDALEASIAEGGYSRATVADIVRRARTSRRTFYE